MEINEPGKHLLPYLQRADELQKHEPLVSYYCRLYAMERGLKIPQSDRTKTTNSLLVSLIKQLEKDKKSLHLSPDDHLHVEGFALNVFSKADKQDRAGRADLNTAKTFYAASIFFEILNQFGEVQPDLEQKQKYAVWKAADIRKAVKEGRKPVPGPPGGDNDHFLPSTTSDGDDEYDLEPNRSDVPMEPEPTQRDPAARISPESDLSTPQHYNQDNFHPSNISRQHSNVTPSIPRSISHTPIYPTSDFPSDNFHQPPSSNIPENTFYHHQSYQDQPHQPEPEQHFPQNYHPLRDVSSYPNSQSYPSFTETSLPIASTHQPSYHQASSSSVFASTAQYSSSVGNGNVPGASPHTAETYEYDSSYQPPPEKIAEAHKAARFAVGALAFDDVPTAIDHLRKSLELLTNPSAGH